MPAQKAIDSTTQKFLDIHDISNNLIILKEGFVSFIVSISAMNFGLLAEQEQDAVIYTYAALLNSLNYPIQILIQSQTKDATNYLNLLKEQEQAASSRNKAALIANYRNFVSQLIKQRNVLDKKFYVIAAATPLELGLVSAESFIPGKNEFDITKYDKPVILEKAQSILEPRRDHLISQFARIGLFARQLETQEIIKIFYTNYNPEASEGLEIADSAEYSTPLVRTSFSLEQAPAFPQQQIGTEQNYQNTQQTYAQNQSSTMQEAQGGQVLAQAQQNQTHYQEQPNSAVAQDQFQASEQTAFVDQNQQGQQMVQDPSTSTSQFTENPANQPQVQTQIPVQAQPQTPSQAQPQEQIPAQPENNLHPQIPLEDPSQFAPINPQTTTNNMNVQQPSANNSQTQNNSAPQSPEDSQNGNISSNSIPTTNAQNPTNQLPHQQPQAQEATIQTTQEQVPSNDSSIPSPNPLPAPEIQQTNQAQDQSIDPVPQQDPNLKQNNQTSSLETSNPTIPQEDPLKDLASPNNNPVNSTQNSQNNRTSSVEPSPLEPQLETKKTVEEKETIEPIDSVDQQPNPSSQQTNNTNSSKNPNQTESATKETSDLPTQTEYSNQVGPLETTAQVPVQEQTPTQAQAQTVPNIKQVQATESISQESQANQEPQNSKSLRQQGLDQQIAEPQSQTLDQAQNSENSSVQNSLNTDAANNQNANNSSENLPPISEIT